MSLYFAKTPNIIQKIFKNFVWSFSSSVSDKKVIYLTFDDGPTPEITNWTLNILKVYNANATFFCIGKNVKNHPEIAQNIIAQGHRIGNHTHNHLNGWKTNTENYLNNVLIAEKVISTTGNHQTPNSKLQTNKLFRPPYGKIKNKQSKLLLEKGYKIIMWDVLSADFDQSITAEKCLNNVIKNTENGSIVIFHDSLKAEKNLKYALPKVLAHFSRKGYSFKVLE